jgi:DNA-binding CsgD family transcriptional regulator
VIGREREIAEASGFLADAASRGGGIVFAGVPGIGKTTVWAAAVDEAAARGFQILVARPAEAELELAFSVLSDLLAAVQESTLAALPGTQRAALENALRRGEAAGSGFDPAAVGLATLGVLRLLAESAPVVVAIDDLQWVDRPSLRAVTYALRRLVDASVALVGSVRTGVELELPALDRVELGRLTKRHLAELVFERTGRTLSPPQLQRLANLSDGSPYYALELAAGDGLDGGVPETLAGALRVRLAGLSDAARTAGLTAAALGRFDAKVLGSDARTVLDELRAAGVVDRLADARFAHPLLASTLLEIHTAEERRLAHLALANILDDLDERAVHLGHGTTAESEAVAAELEDASLRLDARGAPETAATLAERAAELTPVADQPARTRRLLAAADLYSAAGEGREHVVPLLKQLVETLPPGSDRARALVRFGWLGAQIDTMTGDDAMAHQEQALAEADGAGDVHMAANAVLARMRGLGGDYREALRHAELAVRADGPPNGMFPSAAAELAIARWYAGLGLDEQLFADGIAIAARSAQVSEPYQSPKLQLARALLHAGELVRSRALMLELLELSRELDRVRSTAGCLVQLTELEVRAGKLAQAEAYAAEFAILDRQLRGELGDEWYPTGVVAMHLGRVDDALRILHAGVEYSRSIGSTVWLAHHLWALGHLHLAAGKLTEARDLLAPLPQMLRETGLGEWSAHPVHADAIEALVGLGEIDEAADLTTELEKYGIRLDRPWALATAARSHALLLSARGEIEAALEAAQRALKEHERLDWPLEQARTRLVTGTILRRLGRRRDAGAVLAQARSDLSALRNPLWLARVEAEERRLGGRRATSELTPTEERVAELARRGLRNAEIAAQLYVTPKTVEATLSRVYRKLGVRSRTELAGRFISAE